MADEKNKRSQVSAKTNQEAHAVEEYSESVLSVRRVAKVIRGGRRFAFSALVVVGDRKGRVGVALGKSRDVSAAIAKALRKARKHMFSVPLYKTTVPYTVQGKHSSSKVLIKSAAKGTGVIAGGAVRAVMEALGVRDVLSKTIGSSNPQNAVKATINALKQLRSAKQIAQLRGKTVKDIMGINDVTA
jgi:small subunit ribosomal protein S5